MSTRSSLSPGGLVRRGLSEGGFTLIELLVAGTITAALAGFLVILVSNVGTVWTRATNRLSADAKARYILDQLTVDLQGAQFRDDGNVWFAADILDSTSNTTLWQRAGTSNNAKPVGVDVTATRVDLSAKGKFADTRYGMAGTWLRFFTTRRGANDTTNTATVSAPVAVGYQIVRRFTAATANGVAATNTGYLLHRVEVRPGAVGIGSTARPGVLESGYNLDPTPSVPTNYSRTNLNGARNDGSQTGDPRTVQVITTIPRGLDSVVGENVIDFGIRCYVRDTTETDGLRFAFPAVVVIGTGNLATIRNGYSTLFPHPTRYRASLPPSTPVSGDNFDQIFPEVVDVMVRILTDEGARLIALYEQGGSTLTPPNGVNAQQYWWQLAVANSHVFTRRIVLKAQPL